MAKVLVVDDVPDNVKLLSFNLEIEGYEVLEAMNGEDAIKLTRDEQPDLLLLDVMMPGMSGLDVIRILKSDPETEHIPVILVTANSMDENVAEGLDLGAFDYVIKPYSFTVLSARIRHAIREKQQQDTLKVEREELKEMATTDPLTGISNRRYFFEQMDRETSRAQRNHTSFALLMADIDHFKSINDTYGHQAGDEVLKQAADIVGSELRGVDLMARYGGEEFIVCLPETDPEDATHVAERIRKSIAKMRVDSEEGEIKVTISIGMSVWQLDGDSIEEITNRADKALYHAKQSGRDQVQSNIPD